MSNCLHLSLKKITAIVCAISYVSATQAATVTWETAANTTGKSNLIEGEVVHAWGGGSAASITNAGASGTSSYTFSNVTYSDFTFAPAATGAAFADASNGAASTGDTNMDSLLKALTYTTNGVTTGTQTIGGLTNGQTYQIQIFFNDQRTGTSGRVMTFGDGTNTVNIAAKGTNWGQYAIGTFTADATTQTVTHATNGFGNLHVNAILVVEATTTPVATLSTSSTTASGAYTIDITFTEAITGLQESDFTVANGSIQPSSLTGSGANWTVTVVPAANGDVSVTLPASSVTDIDGENNTNPASNTLVTTYISPGSDQPTPTMSTASSNVSAPFTADINFTEPVSGLELSDLLITNSTLSNLTGSGSTYSILVTPIAQGQVTLDLPKNTVTDLDGDGLMNTASNQLTTTYTAPISVTIYGANTTANSTFDISLTFSDAINGLEAADFQITNGSIVSITPLGRREFANRYFTVTLTAAAPGQVLVQLPASSVASIATPSLENQASNQFTTQCTSDFATHWMIDDQATWTASQKTSSNITLTNGFAEPTDTNSQFSSIAKTFPVKRKARSITFEQSPVWDNWTDVPNVGPSGAGDAPILLPVADNDYYFLGRGSTGGYHAWHSTDMVNWTDNGAITAPAHRWVTTAEYKNGDFYIYLDVPNDHTPNLYIDSNLKDGILGTHMGMVFNDPTNGSDISVFRDNADDRFHIIHEDWSPIRASTHAWDSPLAGHVSSPDGITGFTPAAHVPPVDQRSTPTGTFGTYNHPHVAGTHISNPLTYEIHDGPQNAFGDWTTIKIGTQYYLFGDYEPDPGSGIKAARFTGKSIYGEFDLVGELGSGHPDPTIGFAEGKFYLIRQQTTDHTSPGPWVDGVEARAGVDTDGNGTIDQWTNWQAINETYSHTPGYARVVTKTPAKLDLSSLPEGYGFEFEFRVDNNVVPAVSPIMDSVSMVFEPSNFQEWSNGVNTPSIPDEDHNNNGVSNIIEFATGITSLGDLQPDENGIITLTLSRAAIDDGYSLKLEYSEELDTWTEVTTLTSPVELLTAVTQANGDIKYQFKVEDDIDPKVFWRARVE